MSELTKFNNPNYTIAAHGGQVFLRTNQLGKVLRLTAADCERLIAELDATINILAAEAKANG